MINQLIIAIYLFCMGLITIFAFGQLYLLLICIRKKKKPLASLPLEVNTLPVVTVQLPIYNERYVVDKLINSVCQFDYPSEKLEIQVLDDSDDITTDLIADLCKQWQDKGIDIQHIRRGKRQGFKAGALQYGMERSKGEFVAVFDADFVPKDDFLKKIVPEFENKQIGMVQSRWGYLNRGFSLLTRVQGMALDGHFTIEQSARNFSGMFMNFNGTSGIWRKSCIISAGGWKADTLTEDLDLSYRAQLKGWDFKYVEKVESPSELPMLMSAFKSQQYRWNKGGAETARLYLRTLLFSKESILKRLFGVLHLSNSSVFVCILIASVFSIPVLMIKHATPEWKWIFDWSTAFVTSFFIMIFFYSFSFIRRNKSNFYSFLWLFPSFMLVYMGMSLHNALAVIEGWLGRKTYFVRTPKFNFSSQKQLLKNAYLQGGFPIMSIFELILGIYFSYGIYLGMHYDDWGLILFHLMLALGFIWVGVTSIRHNYAWRLAE